jgi:hypothetical protein
MLIIYNSINFIFFAFLEIKNIKNRKIFYVQAPHHRDWRCPAALCDDREWSTGTLPTPWLASDVVGMAPGYASIC